MAGRELDASVRVRIRRRIFRVVFGDGLHALRPGKKRSAQPPCLFPFERVLLPPTAF